MKALGAFGLTIVTIALGALVLLCLWGWFIVPLGTPDLTYLHAAGIAVTAETLVISVNPTRLNEDPWNIMSRQAARLIGMPIMLVIGWMIHGLM